MWSREPEKRTLDGFSFTNSAVNGSPVNITPAPGSAGPSSSNAAAEMVSTVFSSHKTHESSTATGPSAKTLWTLSSHPHPRAEEAFPRRNAVNEPQPALSTTESTSLMPPLRLNDGEPPLPLSVHTSRVRWSTYVPGWVVPLRTDRVSRREKGQRGWWRAGCRGQWIHARSGPCA